MEEVKTKICTKCGEEKLAKTKYFYRHRLGRMGLNPVCKSCASAIAKKKRDEDRITIRRNNKCIICKSTLLDKIKSARYCDVCRKKVERVWKRNEYYRNRERYLLYSKNNRDKLRIYEREINKKRRDGLSSIYVKKLLCEKHGFTREHLSTYPMIIEVKQLQLKIKRTCKTSTT